MRNVFVSVCAHENAPFTHSHGRGRKFEPCIAHQIFHFDSIPYRPSRAIERSRVVARAQSEPNFFDGMAT